MNATTTSRPGFSLVELIVALMILTVGILAMGTSTGYIMREIRFSQLRSERVAAFRETAEIFRGTDWNQLGSVCGSSFPFDHFKVTCRVESSNSNAVMRFSLVATATDAGVRRLFPTADTLAISIARP